MLISEAINYANRLETHGINNAYLVIDNMEEFLQFILIAKYALKQMGKQGDIK